MAKRNVKKKEKLYRVNVQWREETDIDVWAKDKAEAEEKALEIICPGHVDSVEVDELSE